jgi:hypothetical protein
VVEGLTSVWGVDLCRVTQVGWISWWVEAVGSGWSGTKREDGRIVVGRVMLAEGFHDMVSVVGYDCGKVGEAREGDSVVTGVEILGGLEDCERVGPGTRRNYFGRHHLYRVGIAVGSEELVDGVEGEEDDWARLGSRAAKWMWLSGKKCLWVVEVMEVEQPVFAALSKHSAPVGCR